MFNFEFVSECLNSYKSNEVSNVVSDRETMLDQWYWEVGESAANVILGAIGTSFLSRVDNVLDLPCGHGRVLRHLKALFPNARMTACDLDESGVDFCAKTFGADPVVSKPDLADVDFARQFDLIWMGSLFTHTSEQTTRRWLKHVSEFVSDTGIIVATFHGRKSIIVNETNPYISRVSWENIMKGYRETGYGYDDYPAGESHTYIDSSYGVSLSKPQKIIEIAQEIAGLKVYSYTESGWADHQDVLVIGRPGLSAE